MNIWSIDVWSLGITLIEIIHGSPISVIDRLQIRTVDQKNKIRESLIYTETEKPNNEETRIACLHHMEATIKELFCQDS